MMRLILMQRATTCCGYCNVKTQRRGQMPTAASRHADPFSMRATMLSTSLKSGGSEGDLMRLNGWKSRAMVDRYADDVANQRALEAKRYKGDMF